MGNTSLRALVSDFETSYNRQVRRTRATHSLRRKSSLVGTRQYFDGRMYLTYFRRSSGQKFKSPIKLQWAQHEQPSQMTSERPRHQDHDYKYHTQLHQLRLSYYSHSPPLMMKVSRSALRTRKGSPLWLRKGSIFLFILLSLMFRSTSKEHFKRSFSQNSDQVMHRTWAQNVSSRSSSKFIHVPLQQSPCVSITQFSSRCARKPQKFPVISSHWLVTSLTIRP